MATAAPSRGDGEVHARTFVAGTPTTIPMRPVPAIANRGANGNGIPQSLSRARPKAAMPGEGEGCERDLADVPR